MRHVALLRGINVGGRNKLPMARLRELFDAAGATDVRTYIQSGNVVFRAAPEAVDGIAEAVRSSIQAELGLVVPVVTRTAAELVETARVCPYSDEAAQNPRAVHVMFLDREPSADEVATLDPDRSPPDVFQVIGREVHAHCPNGLARTKLSNAWFDRALGTVSTGRNWRTLQKLIALSSAED